MKRILLATAICVLSFALASFADICDQMIMFKQGSSVTMTNYNAKGKVTGSTRTDFVSVEKKSDEVVVTANVVTFDKKGETSGTSGSVTYKCKDGILYMDLRSIMPVEQATGGSDVNTKIETSYLEFPSELTVGTTLKDGYITVKSELTEGGSALNLMHIRIFNRKVEAKESVTTPAGTFECYKISSDFESKMIFKSSGKSISWFNAEVGTVKSENYTSSGKLSGKSEITEYKK